MPNITAVVLCGGKGTRLRPILPDRPKCLAEVNGRPFIFYILDQLVKAKVGRIALAANYLGEMVQHIVGTMYNGVPIYYSYDTIENGGTGHAARTAIEYLGTDNVLVLNGDTYIDFPLINFIFYARDLPWMEVGFVLNVWNGITNMGMYFLNKECITNYIPKSKPYSLEKSLLSDVFECDVKSYIINAPYIDIGTPDAYAKAGEFMKMYFKGE